MYLEFFNKKYENPDLNLIKIFEEKNTNKINNIIEINNIFFCSLCEHHMLPFKGHVHIKYLPKNGKILGISKFARIVEHFSSGLQIQERLTSQIAEFIFSKLEPQGVEVIVEAEHLCMTVRGVKSTDSKTKTHVILGNF